MDGGARGTDRRPASGEADMSNTWVVVADGGSARIFTADSPTGRLTEREDYANSEARVKERRLVSDRKGQTIDSSGRRHAYSGEVAPQEAGTRAFARLIAERLRGARAGGELDRVVLVAAPDFLGKLRKALDRETKKCVESELSLDLTSLSEKEIGARLAGRLGAAVDTH
jgi:protein required for attachment to host cells